MAHRMLQNKKYSAGVSCLIATQKSILNLNVCLQKLPKCPETLESNSPVLPGFYVAEKVTMCISEFGAGQYPLAFGWDGAQHHGCQA